jgi:uncharacterized protein YggE
MMSAKIIIVLALFVFAGFGLIAWNGSQASVADTDPGIITVTGDAEVRVVPDEVILTLGIETWDENLSTAKRQNDARANAVLNAVEGYGIESRYIQTDHISIEPIYEHYDHRGKLTGYLVRKTMVITLKDLTKFEDLLTATLDAGANYVHGIQFRTTELRQHRDKARSLAIQAAQEKAQAMAGELNQAVGKPRTINENQAGWWSWYNRWWGSRGGMMTQNVIQEVGGVTLTEETIAPGQITVRAQVTVSFELE